MSDTTKTLTPGMRRVRARFLGTSPLLCNPMSEETLEQLRTKKKKASAAGSERTVEDEAAAQVPYDDDGHIALPIDNIIACLVDAGTADHMKLAGKSKVSTKEATRLFSIMYFNSKFIVLDNGVDGGEPTWKADKRRGVGKQAATPTAVCIVRPRFDSWGFTLEFTYDSRTVDRSLIYALCKEAGVNRGLGGFRPNKGRGRFGMFRLVEWNEEATADEVLTVKVFIDGEEVDAAVAFKSAEPAKKGGKKKAAPKTDAPAEKGNGDGTTATPSTATPAS